MDPWGWIVVYAVGLVVLQLLVYRYLLNSDSEAGYDAMFGDGDDRPDGSVPPGSDRTGHAHPPRVAVSQQPTPDGPNEGGEGRYCPHCGRENEPDTTFDRCWNCTRRLA